MSSPIRDAEKINQRKIESAKNRNEREIKKLDKAHQDHKVDLKKSQELEIVDIQDNHHRFLKEETAKKEKILAGLKSNLSKTTEITDKQLKELKNSADIDRSETNKKLSYDRERMNAENELFIKDMNDQFIQQSRKVSVEGKNNVENIKLALNDEATSTEQFYKDKIDTQTQVNTIRFNEDEKNYKNLKYNQDTVFKKERLSTNQRQQFQLQKMTSSHNDYIEKIDTDYRKGLKDQDLFFEKKYASQINKNNSDFKILEEKNKATLETLKAGLTKELTKAAIRNDDPFFKFETLKPRLKQFDDRVEIEVDLPDHSKEDVQLTINGKEAIVNFGRRYSDASKGPDGTINKINKVETFTTRLPTNHILDPKSIKSTYGNGVMSYVIKKA